MDFTSKLNHFLRQMREADIKVFRNKKSCCRSCAEFPTAAGKPYIWNFGGQGQAIETNGDNVYRKVGKGRVETIYFYHDNLGEREKTLILLALAIAGLDYDWSGSDNEAIQIHTKASQPKSVADTNNKGSNE